MYTVYKITNNINQKYYIGVHETEDPHDSYMGSGVAIIKAIKKYGVENFKKEILFLFDNKEEAYDKEKQLLEHIWNSSETYNMNSGGKGSWNHVNSMHSKNNCMHDPRVVSKMVETSKKRGSYHTQKRIKASAENAKLGSLARTGSKDSDEVKEKRNRSVKNTLSNPEIRQKMIDAIREKRCIPYVLISPDGIEYFTDVVSELCRQLDLPLSTVTTCSDGRQIKRGKLKGWIIKKGGNS